MRILIISMPSIHTKRWISNITGQGYELMWFDILNRGVMTNVDSVQQIVNWQERKTTYKRGEYNLKKRFPGVYRKIQPVLEVTIDEKFRELLEGFKPHIVHSFELWHCTLPLLKTMLDYPQVKWVYSCWGSDLYSYKEKEKNKIKCILARINYLFTDCKRDYKIAQELGFKGNYLGTIPGGGGFDLASSKKYNKPIEKRNYILVKGYQHKYGRALEVIKALEKLETSLKDYKIIVFATHQAVIDYIKDKNLPFKYFERHELDHMEVMKLMGASLISIGNSISDGMPNTLLEAMIMGALPVQSNPGGATGEVVQNKVNGLLIENPRSVDEIAEKIEFAIHHEDFRIEASKFNAAYAQKELDREVCRRRILRAYENI